MKSIKRVLALLVVFTILVPMMPAINIQAWAASDSCDCDHICVCPQQLKELTQIQYTLANSHNKLVATLYELFEPRTVLLNGIAIQNLGWTPEKETLEKEVLGTELLTNFHIVNWDYYNPEDVVQEFLKDDVISQFTPDTRRALNTLGNRMPRFETIENASSLEYKVYGNQLLPIHENKSLMVMALYKASGKEFLSPPVGYWVSLCSDRGGLIPHELEHSFNPHPGTVRDSTTQQIPNIDTDTQYGGTPEIPIAEPNPNRPSGHPLPGSGTGNTPTDLSTTFELINVPFFFRQMPTYNSKDIDYRVSSERSFLNLFMHNNFVEAYLVQAVHDGLIPRDQLTQSVVNSIQKNYFKRNATSVPSIVLPNEVGGKVDVDAAGLLYGVHDNYIEFNTGYQGLKDETYRRIDMYVLAAQIMHMNGEPVLNDIERNTLLSAYGGILPQSIGNDNNPAARDSLMYLIARGVLPPIKDFSQVWLPPTLEECMVLLSRIADPSARLDFKNVTVPAQIAAAEAGLHQVQINTDSVESVPGSYEIIEERESSSYDYLVEVVKGWTEVVFVPGGSGNEIFLTTSNEPNTQKIIANKVGEFRGKVQIGGKEYYHFRVGKEVVSGAGNPIGEKIYLNTSNTGDLPEYVELDSGGGVYSPSHGFNKGSSNQITYNGSRNADPPYTVFLNRRPFTATDGAYVCQEMEKVETTRTGEGHFDMYGNAQQAVVTNGVPVEPVPLMIDSRWGYIPMNGINDTKGTNKLSFTFYTDASKKKNGVMAVLDRYSVLGLDLGAAYRVYTGVEESSSVQVVKASFEVTEGAEQWTVKVDIETSVQIPTNPRDALYKKPGPDAGLAYMHMGSDQVFVSLKWVADTYGILVRDIGNNILLTLPGTGYEAQINKQTNVIISGPAVIRMGTSIPVLIKDDGTRITNNDSVGPASNYLIDFRCLAPLLAEYVRFDGVNGLTVASKANPKGTRVEATYYSAPEVKHQMVVEKGSKNTLILDRVPSSLANFFIFKDYTTGETMVPNIVAIVPDLDNSLTMSTVVDSFFGNAASTSLRNNSKYVDLDLSSFNYNEDEHLTYYTLPDIGSYTHENALKPTGTYPLPYALKNNAVVIMNQPPVKIGDRVYFGEVPMQYSFTPSSMLRCPEHKGSTCSATTGNKNNCIKYAPTAQYANLDKMMIELAKSGSVAADKDRTADLGKAQWGIIPFGAPAQLFNYNTLIKEKKISGKNSLIFAAGNYFVVQGSNGISASRSGSDVILELQSNSILSEYGAHILAKNLSREFSGKQVTPPKNGGKTFTVRGLSFNDFQLVALQSSSVTTTGQTGSQSIFMVAGSLTGLTSTSVQGSTGSDPAFRTLRSGVVKAFENMDVAQIRLDNLMSDADWLLSILYVLSLTVIPRVGVTLIIILNVLCLMRNTQLMKWLCYTKLDLFKVFTLGLSDYDHVRPRHVFLGGMVALMFLVLVSRGMFAMVLFYIMGDVLQLL